MQCCSLKLDALKQDSKLSQSFKPLSFPVWKVEFNIKSWQLAIKLQYFGMTLSGPLLHLTFKIWKISKAHIYHNIHRNTTLSVFSNFFGAGLWQSRTGLRWWSQNLKMINPRSLTCHPCCGHWADSAAGGRRSSCILAWSSSSWPHPSGYSWPPSTQTWKWTIVNWSKVIKESVKMASWDYQVDRLRTEWMKVYHSWPE